MPEETALIPRCKEWLDEWELDVKLREFEA